MATKGVLKRTNKSRFNSMNPKPKDKYGLKYYIDPAFFSRVGFCVLGRYLKSYKRT
jgi:hypothetical protein